MGQPVNLVFPLFRIIIRIKEGAIHPEITAQRFFGHFCFIPATLIINGNKSTETENAGTRPDDGNFTTNAGGDVNPPR
jgi:hypothetical protein